MHSTQSSDVIYVKFDGTQYGLPSADTTACADSTASMLANNVLVLSPRQQVTSDTADEAIASQGTVDDAFRRQR